MTVNEDLAGCSDGLLPLTVRTRRARAAEGEKAVRHHVRAADGRKVGFVSETFSEVFLTAEFELCRAVINEELTSFGLTVNAPDAEVLEANPPNPGLSVGIASNGRVFFSHEECADSSQEKGFWQPAAWLGVYHRATSEMSLSKELPAEAAVALLRRTAVIAPDAFPSVISDDDENSPARLPTTSNRPSRQFREELAGETVDHGCMFVMPPDIPADLHHVAEHRLTAAHRARHNLEKANTHRPVTSGNFDGASPRRDRQYKSPGASLVGVYCADCRFNSLLGGEMCTKCVARDVHVYPYGSGHEDVFDPSPALDDAVWPTEFDELVDKWIMEYSVHFSLCAALWCARNAPNLVSSVTAAIPDSPFVSKDPQLALRRELDRQIFVRTRLRRDVPVEGQQVCPLCSELFWPSIRDSGSVVGHGLPRLCEPCADAPRVERLYGPALGGGWTNPTLFDEESVIAALQFAAQTAGLLGPTKLARDVFVEHSPYREVVYAAELCLPTHQQLRNVDGSRTMTDWLVVADLLDSGLRWTRGHSSVASDGHRCRSLLERQIEEFFIINGVEHVCEPDYPWHSTLNPSGRRADWIVGNGVFVEAAGMLGDAAYAEKMEEKRRLADLSGIQLVVVTPEDLEQLADLFLPYMDK